MASHEHQVAELRERLERTEQHMAQTLMRATRLAQVISVLGTHKDLATTVERAALEVGELFFADMALLVLDSDVGLRIAGHWGVAASDLPDEPFALPEAEMLTLEQPVRIGPVGEVPVPPWLVPYAPRHVAWARLLVGDASLGLMLLARRGDEPFETSEANELRAVAHRIAVAVENSVLHQGLTEQLAQLHRLQQLTSVLAGTLEIDAVGQRVADTLVSEAEVSACVVLIERDAEFVVLSSSGAARELGIGADGERAAPLDERWKCFPLKVADTVLGIVGVTGAPPVGSERHRLVLHLVSLGALALDKALLYGLSREQARRDSLTGLLGHRVYQEVLESQIAAAMPFSVLLFDIDDFKLVNDTHGHQTGDIALCLVSDALRQAMRGSDSVFRIGGEEFCAVLPHLGEQDALAVAERMRQRVASTVSALPDPLTVSVGVASFPAHGTGRDELIAAADAALYTAKRSGKNRTRSAGEGRDASIQVA